MREVICRNRNLNGAGHRKGVIRADTDELAGSEVKGGDSVIATLRGRCECKLILKRPEWRTRGAQSWVHREREQPCKDSNEAHLIPQRLH
jgi:hypothetical protein